MPESESQKQERQVSWKLQEVYGAAKRQPGSGNQATAPNDVVVKDRLHVECKTTSAASIIFKFDWIARAEQLAKQFKVKAVVAIRFHKFFPGVDYFVIPDLMFYNLLKQELENEKLINENTFLHAQLRTMKARLHSAGLKTKNENEKPDDAYKPVKDAYEGQL